MSQTPAADSTGPELVGGPDQSSLADSPSVVWVDSCSSMQDMLDSLSGLPTEPPSLYLDLEGIKLSRHGTISILQILISPGNQTYLVDIHTLGNGAFIVQGGNGETLKMILESIAIPKVFFDVRNDAAALYANFDIRLAGIQDIQLMELETRSPERQVKGLSGCIKENCRIPWGKEAEWKLLKDKGRRMFAPELGGRYEVFNLRPLPPDLKAYCVQDVLYMPELWRIFSSKLTQEVVEKVKERTQQRVKWEISKCIGMMSTTTCVASEGKTTIPISSTSHPDDPIPEEPTVIPHLTILHDSMQSGSQSSAPSITAPSETSVDSDAPLTPITEISDDVILDTDLINKPSRELPTRRRRASTVLISQNSEDVQRILGSVQPGTSLLGKVCCGGGCCKLQPLQQLSTSEIEHAVVKPKNPAFEGLNLYLGKLSLNSNLTGIIPLPEKTVSFSSISPADAEQKPLGPPDHPPKFLQPHAPYEVYRAPLHHARELTRPGAEKRTYHFDIDVTDYPVEGGNVDFVVGGAIGVCPENSAEVVEETFDLLGVPKYVRDKKTTLHTSQGRWPTIWGDEEARDLLTTRRELLSWCSDLQSYPPTKPLLRLMAEYASNPDEKKILMYLCSAQGQAAFCDLRTGPYVTVPQLLAAFPSSQPPLDHLLSILNTLMPRFYSLSQDPFVSKTTDAETPRRIIEIAVTVHECPDWRGGQRTGLGSGFLERVANKFIDAEKTGADPGALELHIPMFRGLMSNPLAREFVSDGPMLLIGAGVGIAPFRGFVQSRLRSANCANKVWVIQGIRDSSLDELYSGEWGAHETDVKRVVESRVGEGRYVQGEVRFQADLVWFVINSLDGRVFVCGSSKGMGEGVEQSLVDVVMAKGNLNRQEAEQFWKDKKDAGQYIAETW
ncbi:hypothetical protein FQN57_006023 [Myotisia sp. PD_48]|nr:hypothetical protein FQN57_006023 [Myotisia sp. PD_48]